MDKELEADKKFSQMMKDKAVREEMDRLATPNQWKADKEFTDISDDKFPGKDRIKRILAYVENDRNNTKVQIPEPVGKWLESRGIDADTLLRFEPLLKKYENLSGEEKERFDELKDFEPNPGKATLNRIGETKYVAGDRGLPIYQEDVDMIKKSQPLAKKLVELQKKNQDPEEEKEKETLRTLKDIIDEVYEINPEELNMGPDTTENINEVRVDDIPGKAQLKSQGMEKNEDEETPDVMWYFDPESERFKPASESIDEEDPGKAPAATECNKNVSDHGKDYSYSSILRQMDDTHTRKNNDYGDAAYQGYKKYGPAYFLVQLHNKLSRLESLTINNRSQMVKDESIDDTLLDMANYAIMFLESRHRDD